MSFHEIFSKVKLGKVGTKTDRLDFDGDLYPDSYFSSCTPIRL